MARLKLPQEPEATKPVRRGISRASHHPRGGQGWCAKWCAAKWRAAKRCAAKPAATGSVQTAFEAEHVVLVVTLGCLHVTFLHQQNSAGAARSQGISE